MLSKALLHFPQFRFRDGKKMLWNPILKKLFVNRPEERFRLELVDYLILEAAFSPHRISFESPVKLPSDKTSSRTDLICYDGDFKPLLLVECKSGDIMLDEKAAIQVARYNQKVNAPYILVSNGLLDYWFSLKSDSTEDRNPLLELDSIPDTFTPKKETERSFQYWKERGFTGSESHPDIRNFLVESCNQLFTEPKQHVIFLNFDDFSPEMAPPNYYRIFKFEDQAKLALSISATPFGGTRLNAVLNQKGANVAFLSSSLDLIAKEEPVNTEIHSAKGIKHLDLIIETGFTFEKKINEFISTFKKLLNQNS